MFGRLLLLVLNILIWTVIDSQKNSKIKLTEQRVFLREERRESILFIHFKIVAGILKLFSTNRLTIFYGLK
jgi:hypothetical protein